jgi:CheY-like chemotaxis protein
MRKLKVLVVEDEPANQEVVEIILESAGHEVRSVGNGQEALEVLIDRGEAYDVVLMDILMPVMDGLTATQQLRAHERTRHLSILCVSARASGSDRESGMRAGCDAYITKPYKRRDFLKALHDMLVARGVITPGESIGLDAP